MSTGSASRGEATRSSRSQACRAPDTRAARADLRYRAGGRLVPLSAFASCGRAPSHASSSVPAAQRGSESRGSSRRRSRWTRRCGPGSEARQILPSGFTFDYAGESRQAAHRGEHVSSALSCFCHPDLPGAAAQFESFRDPFIILAAPCRCHLRRSLFSFLGLTTLNIYSQVGLGHAGGTGYRRRDSHRRVRQPSSGEGLPKVQAVVEAAGTRLGRS